MPQPMTVSNPFLLMLDPEQVLQAVERSQPLTTLRRRLCRPLDKGLPEDAGQGGTPDAVRPSDDGASAARPQG